MVAPPQVRGFYGADHRSIVKILIVDDHSLIREGLQAVLSRSALSAQCFEARDATSAWNQLDQHPEIDFVLIDVQLPDSNALELLTRIVQRRPELPVVMMSSFIDANTVAHAIDLGASGFLPKNLLSDVLVCAIQLVAVGGIYIPREALQAVPPNSVPAELKPAEPMTLKSFRFTARQTDIVRLLLQGMSNKQICRKVDLAEATVKIHVRAILRVLKVSSRAEAIVKANQIGLHVPDEKPAIQT